jgi:hypothetical protein
VERAQPVTSIDLAHCVAVASQKARPDETRCPGFIGAAVASGMQTCGEAGGKLVPHATPAVWSVDVNGDGKPEYLFELSANVECDEVVVIGRAGDYYYVSRCNACQSGFVPRSAVGRDQT